MGAKRSLHVFRPRIAGLTPLKTGLTPLVARPVTQLSGADLKGPHIYHISVCDRSQKHKVPTNGTYNWSPGLSLGATYTIFRAGAVPGAPGAPEGRKSPKNPGPDLSFYPPKGLPSKGLASTAAIQEGEPLQYLQTAATILQKLLPTERHGRDGKGR